MDPKHPPQSRREFLSTTGALAAAALAAQAALGPRASAAPGPRELTTPIPVDPGVKFSMRGKIPIPTTSPTDRVPDAIIPDPPQNARLYKSMDLMMYLLRAPNNVAGAAGITYEDLYGESAYTAASLIRQVFLPRIKSEDHWRDHFTEMEKNDVVTVFEALQGELDKLKSMTTFRDVYLSTTKENDTADPGVAVICKRLKQVRAIAPQFCTPFIYLPAWTKDQITCVLDYYGSFTLLDLALFSKEPGKAGDPWHRPPTNKPDWPSDSVFNVCGLPTPIEDESGLTRTIEFQFLDFPPVLIKGIPELCTPNNHKCSVGDPYDNCFLPTSNCFCSLGENGKCSILSCCKP